MSSKSCENTGVRAFIWMNCIPRIRPQNYAKVLRLLKSEVVVFLSLVFVKTNSRQKWTNQDKLAKNQDLSWVRKPVVPDKYSYTRWSLRSSRWLGFFIRDARNKTARRRSGPVLLARKLSFISFDAKDVESIGVPATLVSKRLTVAGVAAVR